MYYILHGEDELSRTETITKLRAKMGDPQFGDLNTTWFDGRKVSFGELQHACDAMPFLTDKRLVIVEGLLARFDPRHAASDDDTGNDAEANPDFAKALRDYLPRLPETARLVFIETKSLAKNNSILKFALAVGDEKIAFVKEFAAPAEKDLPRWILTRVKSKGGEIEPLAVTELAMHVGADLRLFDTEIEKLLIYRRNEIIRVSDVRALVNSVRESDVFGLVDAIGRRETALALKLLHEQLAQGENAIYLLSMIVRQFRLLLQMRDLATRGKTVDMAAEQIRLHPFVAKKTWGQAANFTVPQLEAIYRRLLDADLAMKTSRSEPVVALDVLVVDLTRK